MGRSIQLDSNGDDITCMKEFDALKYPCKECNREDCKEYTINQCFQKLTEYENLEE